MQHPQPHKTLWVSTMGERTTCLDQASARKGLDLLNMQLTSADFTWHAPEAFELKRASETDSNFASGSDVRVFHIQSSEPALREKLEAALQIMGVLNRQRGIYNGVILRLPGVQARCAILVNAKGRAQIKAFMQKTKEAETALG